MKTFTIENETNNITLHGSGKEAELVPDSERFNSEAALAQYAFDSNNFTGKMLTDLRKGTASMVSGDIARSSPSAMKVRTPTATLGVRGTSFAIEVGGK